MICVRLVDLGLDHRILSLDRGENRFHMTPLEVQEVSKFRRYPMVSAIVLLTVERDKINSVADAIADIDGVSEVYSIAGRYDLAAIIRVKTNDDMAKVVTERIRKVGGITSSETLISFRVYSRHDLERMFSIGLEHPS